MTNLPEAKLAREAEMALATLAMITDYDCWKVEEEAVTAESVIGHLHANVAAAKAILAQVIPNIPEEPNWPEHRALDCALMTRPQAVAGADGGESAADFEAICVNRILPRPLKNGSE